MKKLLCVVLCALLTLSLCSCTLAQDLMDSINNETPVEKTFTKGDVSITLDSSFLTMDFVDEETYDFIWSNSTTTVMGQTVAYNDVMTDAITAEQYAEAFRTTALIGITPGELVTVDNIPMFSYETPNSKGELLSFLLAFYKGKDGILILIMSVPSSKFEAQYDTLCGYAKSLTLS